jgi:hypothetical protein
MSADDFVVNPLSDSEVRENADRVRRFLGLANVKRVDPLVLEQIQEIWTVRGLKPFRLEIVPDDRLPNEVGLTTFDGSKILVQIPRRIRHDAFLGDGYARNTFGHELGHATLHFDKLTRGAAMPRRSVGNVTPGWIPKFKSAEHQVKVFAAAFFINDEIGRQLRSPEQISIEFGVSLQSAQIYFEQVQEEIARPASSARVRRMADEVRATLAPKPVAVNSPSFLNELCSRCDQPKLFPVGHKYMCQGCDAIYDRFQDGDRVE